MQTLVRCEEGRVTLLRGAELTRFTDAGKQVEQLSDARQYRRLAAEAFVLPALPIDEAVRALELPTAL